MNRSFNSISAEQLARVLGPWSHSGAIYEDLASAIRHVITDGRLQPDTRVPAERVLARHLGVSRNSVAAAYDLLREEGYLHSRRGAGSYVSLPTRAGTPRVVTWAADGTPAEIDFALAALPAPEPLFTEAMVGTAAELAQHTGQTGYDLTGVPSLRKAIADRYTLRGLPTRPEEIMVTNGAQQSWALLLRLLSGNGDRVLMESPGHPTVHNAVRLAGGRPVSVSVGPAGWDVDMIRTTLQRARPVLGYLMPDFQNPTGHVMPAAARRAVAVAAREAGTRLVVEDTVAELGIGPGLLPAPLAAYGTPARVITIGSMSKVCWGGLRVGWIRTTASMIARLARVRESMDAGNPIVQQFMTVRLLAGYDGLIVARRRLLAERLRVLAGALRDQLPAWSFTEPPGGLVLWARLDRPVSTRLARAAADHGVRVPAGPRFGLGGTFENYLRVPFVQPPETLVEGVRRLAQAERDLGGRDPGDAPGDGPGDGAKPSRLALHSV
ncbi:PLP-dependent aminotransferase family protein [Spirillospora sp. NPDC047279]|uniref:MocR-like transcription factor YczR n=1 Tax=Spirillospora sp. NPDC047279 TaxID=3155478 RepID=UPI0033E7B6AF